MAAPLQAVRRIVREFAGQHVGGRTLTVFGGRLQQRARARRIGQRRPRRSST